MYSLFEPFILSTFCFGFGYFISGSFVGFSVEILYLTCVCFYFVLSISVSPIQELAKLRRELGCDDDEMKSFVR